VAEDAALAALVRLLDDPAAAAPILARLEREPALFDRVWAAAGAEPAPELVELALRDDAEALVDTYLACTTLEPGVWLLARLHAPRRDHAAACAPQLDDLARRARAAGAGDPGAAAAWLCGACGFAGDRSAYDDPQNSFLPCVLERRLGLPIALTALWLLLCRRLDLAAEAVALPGHVVGRWAGGFTDLFAGGRTISRDELDLRARLAGGRDAGPWLAAASDHALLRRMARNLTLSYLRRQDATRASIAHGMASG
jgi:hypothetical protein